MSRRFLAEVTAVVCVLFGFSVTKCPAADGEETPGKNVFGTTKVWDIHLEIPAKEYEAMQPPAGGFGFPVRRPRTPAPKGQARQRAQPLRHRVPLGAGRLLRGRQDLQEGRRPLCRRHHLLRVRPGPETSAEDRVQQVRRPAIPRAHVAPSPCDADGPGEGPRGPGLLACSGRRACPHRAPPSPRSP